MRSRWSLLRWKGSEGPVCIKVVQPVDEEAPIEMELDGLQRCRWPPCRGLGRVSVCGPDEHPHEDYQMIDDLVRTNREAPRPPNTLSDHSLRHLQRWRMIQSFTGQGTLTTMAFEHLGATRSTATQPPRAANRDCER